MKLAVQKNIATYLICVTLLAVTTIGLGILIYNVNKKDDNNGTNPNGDHVQASTTYNITWRQYNGTFIMTTPAEKGTLLSSLAPEMKHLQIPANNAQYDYSFGNWATGPGMSVGNPFTDADKVTEPADYYVAYAANKKSYSVTFKVNIADTNNDGDFDDANETITKTEDSVLYGNLPRADLLEEFDDNFWDDIAGNAANPREFIGWDQKIGSAQVGTFIQKGNIPAVTGETVYTAVLEPIHYFTLLYTADGLEDVTMEEQDFPEQKAIITYTITYKEDGDDETTTVTKNSLYETQNFIKGIKDQENITMVTPAPYYSMSYGIPRGLPEYTKTNPTKDQFTDSDEVEWVYKFGERVPWENAQWADDTCKVLVRRPKFQDRERKTYSVTYVDHDGKVLDTEYFRNRVKLNDTDLAYSGNTVPEKNPDDIENKGYIFNGQWTFTHIINGDIVDLDRAALKTNGLEGNTTATAQYTEVCKELYDVYMAVVGIKGAPNKGIDVLLQGLYYVDVTIKDATELNETQEGNAYNYFMSAF